jgi:hypothetical protein
VAIIDGLDDQRGLQTLVTGIANVTSEAQHSSDILYHSNGYLYVVVCQSYSNAVQQRRLYLYRSTDGGNTWTLITNLTTGAIDGYPVLLQLDSSTDIGILHLRFSASTSLSGVIHRMVVDEDGTEVVSNDPITGSPSINFWPHCVFAGGEYKIITSAGRFSRGVSTYSNTSFTLNTWVFDGTANLVGATSQCHIHRIRMLSSGDIMAVVTYRTLLEGSESGLNGLADNLRTDVGIVISADDGATWDTIQNLTNYSGTAGVSEDGILSALQVDAVELSDGRIAVLYNEGRSYMVINTNTTPAITVTANGTTGDGYTKTILHPTHGYLIYSHANSTSGGIFVHNLATNIVTRLHTASTPSIWENEVVDMAISDDGVYLAAATFEDASPDSGSLEIFDTTDPDPTLWTVTSLRSATTPAILVPGLRRVEFEPGTTDLYFAYAGTAAGSSIWGGKLDASNIAGGVTDLIAPVSIGANILVPGFVIGSTYVYSISNNAVFATNKSTGAGSHTTTFAAISSTGTAVSTIFAIGSNLGIVGSSAFIVVNDGGASFTQVGSTVDSTSNPSFGGVIARSQQLSSGNIIIPMGANAGYKLYCASSGVFYPIPGLISDTLFGYQFPDSNTTRADEMELNGISWLNIPSTANHVRFALDVGRLRVGTFTYNSGTRLVAAGDFYDAVNQIRVGDDWNKLILPRLARTSTDRLIVSAVRFHLNRTSRPKSVITGVIESDAQRFTMRAAILKTTTNGLDMRARIRNTYTSELDMRARLVFAQCIKMQARIVPRVTQTLDMRGTILGSKSTSITGTFNVSAQSEARMQGRFFVATGYNTEQTLTMGASIVKRRTSRITGRYLVTQGDNTPAIQSYVVGFDTISLQTLKIGAGITK